MKMIRILSAMLVAAMLFTFGVAATNFVPSIEVKEDPKLEDYEAPEGHPEDELIITPLDHLFDEDIELHDDIEKSLRDAYEELKDELIHDLVEDFHEHWDRVTGGAPLENAIVTHLFDVRLRCELDGGSHGTTTVRADSASNMQLLSVSFGGNTYKAVGEEGEQVYSLEVLQALTAAAQTQGVEVTFKVKVLGLTMDDDFLVVYRCDEKDHWADVKEVDYELLEDNILQITGKTMAAYAIVEDNGEPPVVGPDDPDSPQTNVPGYFFPAIIGAVLFAGAAIVCVRKVTKKNAA